MNATGRLTLAAVAAMLAVAGSPVSTQSPSASQTGPAVAGRRAGARGGGIFRQPDPIDFHDHGGWTSLFDGRTLAGWSGDDRWQAEDGAITIESSCEHPTGTIYLVWQGGEAADFELTLEMKGTGNINSGVQYPAGSRRRRPRAPGAPRGAGADRRAPARAVSRGARRPAARAKRNGTWPARSTDFDAGNRYTGQFYEQGTGRGIVAWKGQVVRTSAGDSRRLLATLGDDASVNAIYKPNDWNELHIIAIGRQMTHLLNGRVISILIDDDTARFHGSGLIGLEVEATGKLFVRNIFLKKL